MCVIRCVMGGGEHVLCVIRYVMGGGEHVCV